MVVSNNLIAAERLGYLLKSLGKKRPKARKNLATNVFKKNQGELWTLQQTLAQHLHPKDLKQLYHHYQK